MPQYQHTPVTLLATGKSRPAVDFETRLPKIGEDGIPRILVEVLMVRSNFDTEQTEIHEIEVPAPAGEMPTLAPLSQARFEGVQVDTYGQIVQQGKGKPRAVVRERWSAQKVHAVGQQPGKVGGEQK